MHSARCNTIGLLTTLAFSIKKHSPNVSITVLFDDVLKAISQCPEIVKYVEHFGDINPADIYTNKKLDPGKVKVNLYKYLPYECNLYLDVDAIALKDIQPMIDELSQSGKDYISHCVGYHTIDKGRDFKEMQWAWADRMWAHFNLLPSYVMPAINSSMQWIVKGSQSGGNLSHSERPILQQSNCHQRPPHEVGRWTAR